MTDQIDVSKTKIIADEIRALYSASVSEVADFKHQQWRITNYGLLLYAGIASVPRLLGGQINIYEYVILVVAALAVHISGTTLIGMLADSIQGRRERLTHIRKKYFTDEFRDAWRAGKSEDLTPDRPEEKIQLRMLFKGVFWIGLFTTLWYLWRAPLVVVHR